MYFMACAQSVARLWPALRCEIRLGLDMFELVCTSDGGLRGGAGKTTSPVTSVGQMEVLLTSVCREGFKFAPAKSVL